MNPQQRRQLEQLLSQLCEDSLCEEQHAQLEALLEQHADCRRFYLEYLDLHARLLLHPRLSLGLPLQSTTSAVEAVDLPTFACAQPLEIPTPGRRSSAWSYALVAAASLCVSLLLQIGWQGPAVPPTAQEIRPPSNYVATLVRTEDCVWEPSQAGWRVGARLWPGEMRLTQGNVAIRFDGGAELVVEGPASLRLDTVNSASLLHGKAVFRSDETVEPFELNTPTAQLVDFGTEYAVSVEPSGAEEVHVFDGEIRRTIKRAKQVTSPEADEVEQILAGQARRFVSKLARQGKAVPLDKKRFVMHVSPPQAVPHATQLLAYEGFDYPDLQLPSSNPPSAAGWRSPWRVQRGEVVPLQSASLDRTPSDGTVSRGSLASVGQLMLSRDLATPLRLDQDSLYFFSFLFQRSNTDAPPNTMQVIFRNRKKTTPDDNLGIGISRNKQILFCRFQGGGERAPLPLENNQTYLLVGKLVTGAHTPDQLFLRVYRPGEMVELEEPNTWTLTSRPVRSDKILDQLSLHINSQTPQSLDEFRLGLSWLSVTSAWRPTTRP